MVTPTTGSPVSSVSATGDYRIDALLRGLKWGGPAGTGFDVSYSFPGSGSVFSTSSSGGYGPTTGSGEPWDPDARSLNALQQQYFSEAMDAWSEVANIDAVEVPDNASVVGDIRVSFSGRVADVGAAAWAYYPFPSAVGGDVWLHPFIGNYDNPAPGNSGFYVFLHEIGHALGLSHPFGGGYGVLGDTEDTQQYTVMSYTSYGGVSGWAQTPMLYDILAIQYMYGANYATRAGNTTYTFSAGNESFETIWDGGGVDTLDASAQTLAAEIDLSAGAFSSIGPRAFGGSAFENVAIAFGVTIENATGGSGSDTITGNAVNNLLRGRGGGDELKGLEGDDTLNGGGGGDTLEGGAGNDEIDGGGGTDWAVFSNDLSAYSFVFNADASTTVSFGGSGSFNDGSDLVRNVEQFVFADEIATRDELMDLVGGAFGGGSVITGTASGDTITTTIASPGVIGGTTTIGNDTVDGLNGNDSVGGGEGDDVLRGGYGYDTLDGGPGTDTADISHTTADPAITLGEGSAEGTVQFTGGTEILRNIENVIGSLGDNEITGNSGANDLHGNDGDDTIDGLGGNDSISGGEGDDVLRGGYGYDTLDGGPGTDTADISHTIANPAITLGEGSAEGTVQFTGGTEILRNIENVIGSLGDNEMTGNSGANDLHGNDGDDTIDGLGGVDTLNGGAGADNFVLRTGDGADRIENFQNGTDTFLLDGLNFVDLDFVDAGPDTEIQIASTDEVLAVIEGLEPGAFDSTDFT